MGQPGWPTSSSGDSVDSTGKTVEDAKARAAGETVENAFEGLGVVTAAGLRGVVGLVAGLVGGRVGGLVAGLVEETGLAVVDSALPAVDGRTAVVGLAVVKKGRAVVGAVLAAVNGLMGVKGLRVEPPNRPGDTDDGRMLFCVAPPKKPRSPMDGSVGANVGAAWRA